MSDAPNNRRRFPRIQSENAVFVKKLGCESEEGFAKTRSLGPGGCMFVNPEPLGVGSVIEILIHAAEHVIQAVGRVVYEKENGSGGHEIGLGVRGDLPGGPETASQAFRRPGYRSLERLKSRLPFTSPEFHSGHPYSR